MVTRYDSRYKSIEDVGMRQSNVQLFVYNILKMIILVRFLYFLIT